MKTELIKVNGMTCLYCVHTIKKSLLALKGSKDIDVDLSAKSVKIEYDAEILSIESIKLAIIDAGYDIA
jgi:copper chaperone